MSYEKADLTPRFVAALVDGIIGGFLIYIPFIGGLIYLFYMLLKDGIMYEVLKQEEWKNKSIGKKLMNLEVVVLDDGYVDLSLSAKRNILLSIGGIIAIVPLIGWVFGSLAAVVFSIVEVYFVFTDDKGRRLGDRWANTQVIQTQAIRKEESNL